jgi:hypothetical protein
MLEMRQEAWVHAGFWDLPDMFQGIGEYRSDSRSKEEQLVNNKIIKV